MNNPDLPEISRIGEKHVENWLIENGYADFKTDKLRTNVHALQATGNMQSVLVLVRTVLHPHRPLKFSDYEIDFLKRRAAEKKLVAYAAYVAINENQDLAGEINWERLGKG